MPDYNKEHYLDRDTLQQVTELLNPKDCLSFPNGFFSQLRFNGTDRKIQQLKILRIKF
jgi:hypothetical protein